ncbi:MAG: stage 0 sporulation protein, partial [Corallococcus sp.]|nr:stage 0 sporulation protein [Corallococcus sp.]
MPNIVGIQFKEGGKVYYFLPKDIEFQKGDGAIVETARGVEYGKVAIANKEVSEESIVGELKLVVRKAT